MLGQAGEDPFQEEKRAKKERVKKQAARQLNNMAVSRQASGGGGGGSVPTSLQLAASLPEHGRGRPAKGVHLEGAVSRTAAGQNRLRCSLPGLCSKRTSCVQQLVQK